MAHSTLVSVPRGAPMRQPPGAACVRIAALAVALVLVIALAVAFFVVWLPGDAPDLYAQLDADAFPPIGLADSGTWSATASVFEDRPA